MACLLLKFKFNLEFFYTSYQHFYNMAVTLSNEMTGRYPSVLTAATPDNLSLSGGKIYHHKIGDSL